MVYAKFHCDPVAKSLVIDDQFLQCHNLEVFNETLTS